MLWRRGLVVSCLALVAGASQEAARTSEAAGKLRSFGQALQQQRTALKAEAARLQTEEADEVKRSKLLDKRQQALERKAQEVSALESRLLKEQSKVWSLLHHAGGAAASSASTVAATKGHSASLRQPKAALLQRGSAATTQKEAAQTRSAERRSHARGAAAAKQKRPKKLWGSDVALVSAAGSVPKETAPLPKADPWANSATAVLGREDADQATQDAKLGEFADNDNLLPAITSASGD